jgi:hypothetical protein
MNLKSDMGLFPIDTGWILVYPDPTTGEIAQEHYDKTDHGIINLLYTVKEACLGHYNSKHNTHNIIIKRVKVKE